MTRRADPTETTGRRKAKVSCRYCRDTPRWRCHLAENEIRRAGDVNALLVIQSCPYCRNRADITKAPRDWRRIKREKRSAESHG